MKEIDLAYAAGLFDGEGCIHIKKTRRKDCISGIQYALQVSVRISSKPIVDIFYKFFGGHIYLCKKQKDYHKDLWQWIALANKASNFLKALHPYLIEKRREAELGIEFQKDKKPTTAIIGRRGFLRKPQKVLELEELRYMTMRELKLQPKEAYYG